MFRLSGSLPRYALPTFFAHGLPRLFRRTVPSCSAAETRGWRALEVVDGPGMWLGQGVPSRALKIVAATSPKSVQTNNFEFLVCNSLHRKMNNLEKSKSACPRLQAATAAAVSIAPRRRRYSPTALQQTPFVLPTWFVAGHRRALVLIVFGQQLPTAFSSPDFDTCCTGVLLKQYATYRCVQQQASKLSSETGAAGIAERQGSREICLCAWSASTRGRYRWTWIPQQYSTSRKRCLATRACLWRG